MNRKRSPIGTRNIGDVVVIDLPAWALQVDDRLQGKVSELAVGGHADIVLDLAGVRQFDSAGLAELLACHKRVRESGGTLKLLHVSRGVRRVFELARLVGLFEVHRDESSAVASFSVATRARDREPGRAAAVL